MFAATTIGLSLSCSPDGVASGKQRELAHDHVEVLDRARGRSPTTRPRVHQHLGSFEVAQESVAESMTRVRAFDQPGNVGDDERPVVRQADDAEIRA